MSDLNEFQQQALKSVAITDPGVTALAHRTLGLTGEAGTIANHLKKVIRDKQGKLDEADMATLKEKLGDVLYYTAVLAAYADLKLEDIASDQLAKSAQFAVDRNLKG